MNKVIFQDCLEYIDKCDEYSNNQYKILFV